MVRKQLYLGEDQQQCPKHRARELGLPEAELVRLALNRFLETGDLPLPGHAQVLVAFLPNAAQIAQQHGLPQGWRSSGE
jgi:hypothetical protein